MNDSPSDPSPPTPSPPLHAAYRFTFAEMRAAQAAAHRFTVPVALRWALPVVAVLGLVWVVFTHGNEAGQSLRVYVVMIALYVLLVRRFTTRLMLKRTFLRHPARDAEVRVEASPTHLSWESSPGQPARTRLSAFRRIRRDPTGFLLYSKADLYHWLPHTAFASPADAQLFAEWLRREVADYQEALNRRTL